MTVTPAAASARKTFLACIGVTSAASTTRATSAEPIRPPARWAWLIKVFVSERMSVPVWRASDTDNLPGGDQLVFRTIMTHRNGGLGVEL